MKNESIVKSTLAKLLAHENISVQHGNFSTAFFDVKNRILGLPNWKDKGKDVNDLLVGHEVGHALYTPSDGLDKDHGCSKDYLNIVEDVRIERMIQSTYPGLVAAFRRGYSTLNNDNFFGQKGKNLNSYGIADRINLKAKLGSLLDVPFSQDEMPIVTQVMNVKTWKDTIAAAVALSKFAAEQDEINKKEKPQNSPDNNKADAEKADESSDDASPSSPANSNDQSQKSKGSQDSKSESVAQDETLKSDAKKENSAKEDSKDGPENKAKMDGSENNLVSMPSDNKNPPGTPPVPETSRHFEKSAKDLLDTSINTLRTATVIEPSLKMCQSVIISYKEIFAARNASERYITVSANNAPVFPEFLASTKKYVGVLSKAFEMRKAAYQYSRASISQTGTLNVNRLHSYKCTDDIFLSVTQLANAKNHGMMMFVDYSSSMRHVLPHILKHIINLSLFCRTTGIPFQVYGFTGGHNQARRNYCANSGSLAGLEGEIDLSQLILLDLINSSMSKGDFNRAIKDLHCQAVSGYSLTSVESLGNTPLNEALIVAHRLVPEFQKKHNIQKMITMVLTDGDGQNINLKINEDYDAHRQANAVYPYNYNFTLNGRKFKIENSSRNMTAGLVKNLKITTKSVVIGFFIPANNASARRMGTESMQSLTPTPLYLDAQAMWQSKVPEYRKNKCVCIPGAWNYDEYFIVASGDDLDTEEDDFEITADMSRGRIARAFSDFSKAKQVNKVFVTQFAKSIA